MYTNHFGLRCRAFEDRADPQFLYATPACEELLATMEYEARYGKGMALVLGESGTGKTLLVRALLPRLHTSDQVVVLTWSANSARELVRETCKAFGVTLPSSYNPERGLARLRRHLRRAVKSGHRCVLIIDQAENLTRESLSQLDTISSLQNDDVPLLSTILVGQPRLRATLDRPEFDGLRQRLFAERVVPPLAADEVAHYIQHRLHVAGAPDTDLFDSDAVALIHQASEGIVRLINRICDAALVAAYGSGRQHIGHAIVADVTREQMTSERTADVRDIGFRSTGEWSDGLPGPIPTASRPMTRNDLGRGIARAMNVKPVFGPDGFDDPNEVPSSDVDVIPQGPIQGLGGTDVRNTVIAECQAATPTLLDRLERTIAKAERVSATSEASLTRHIAVERHLASLAANADNLTSRLAPAVDQATKASRQVQERIRNMLAEAESRTEAVAASVARCSESVGETAEQVDFIEKACVRAEHVEARLTTFAEQLADKADQVQARMTELMGGLEASDAAHDKLQTTLGQVRNACTEAQESLRKKLDQVATVNAESSRRADAQEAKLHAVIDRCEQWHQTFADNAIQEYRKNLEEQFAGMERLQSKTVDTAHRSVRDLRDEAAALVSEARTAVQEQRGSYDELVARAETFRNQFVDTTVAGYRDALEAQLEKYRQLHRAVVETTRQQLDELRGQIATVSADASTTLQEQLDAHRQLQDESSQQAEDRLASVQRKIASATSEVDSAVETALEKYHAKVANLLSDSQSQMEELRREMSETIASVPKIRSSFAKLTDDIGHAADRVGAMSDAVTGIGVSVDDLIRRSETAKEQLCDAAEHGERVLPEVVQSCAKLDSLQSSITAMLVDLGSAQERIRGLREETAGAEQVRGRLISERRRGEETAKQLDDSVQTATQLRDDIHRVAVEVEGKMGQLDSHNAAAQNVLHRLADTNMSAHSLISQANEATHTVNQAAAEAKQEIDRLLKDTWSLTATTDARAGEIGEANQKAAELLAQLERATGPADQVARKLTARIEDAVGQCTRIAEQSAQATELAERFSPINDTLTAAKEVDASICSTLQDARGVHDGLSSLTEAAREQNAQLAETNSAAAKLLEMQETLGKESKELATVLADQLRDSASTTDAGRKLLDEFDQKAKAIEGAIQVMQRNTAEIEKRITAVSEKPNEIVAAAKEVDASICSALQDARGVHDGLSSLTEAARERKAQLSDTNRVAAKLIEMQEALGEESKDLATVLADQLRDSASTADAGRKLLEEFDRQAKAIEHAIQALRRKTAEIEERITAAAVKPNEIIVVAKEQAAQLEQVCRAVKKVFAGLAQATLDAKKQTTECRETGSEAAGRLTELRTRTEQATQMLQEWSEEAARVQARLERTIKDCPSIHQTHSNEVLQVLSTPSCTTPSRTTPKTLPANEVCPPVPPPTDGVPESPCEKAQTTLSPRAAEIAQLIEEAKRASGISGSD